MFTSETCTQARRDTPATFLIFFYVIALVYLVARLKYGGFTLLDTQFVTGHLARFGAIEVSREEFQRFLEAALAGGGAGLAHGSGVGASAASGGAAGAGG